MRFIVLTSAILAVAFATKGFDSIDSITASKFECMKNNGYSFYIARVFKSTGAVDTAGITLMKNAWAGGMSHVDGYIFPCVTSGCPSAASQAKSAHDALKNAGVKYGMLWLDIEIFHWPSSHTTNREFIQAMGNELTTLGVNWGVYSNYNNWQSIVGLDWTALSHKQLWWPTYNGQASLSNFKAFGGWTKPNIHQYSGDIAGPCGFSIDQNFY